MGHMVKALYGNKLSTPEDYQRYELDVHQKMKDDGLNLYEEFVVIYTLCHCMEKSMEDIGENEFVDEIKKIGKENGYVD